jgi:hypothetical protein
MFNLKLALIVILLIILFYITRKDSFTPEQLKNAKAMQSTLQSTPVENITMNRLRSAEPSIDAVNYTNLRSLKKSGAMELSNVAEAMYA